MFLISFMQYKMDYGGEIKTLKKWQCFCLNTVSNLQSMTGDHNAFMVKIMIFKNFQILKFNPDINCSDCLKTVNM